MALPWPARGKEWGTPLTCPRDGVGTLVRGQKFTLVRGLRPRTRVNFWPRTRVPIPSWGQVKGVPFQLLDFQNWSFVPGDESGFMECALLSPEICDKVTGMVNLSSYNTHSWYLCLDTHEGVFGGGSVHIEHITSWLIKVRNFVPVWHGIVLLSKNEPIKWHSVCTMVC